MQQNLHKNQPSSCQNLIQSKKINHKGKKAPDLEKHKENYIVKIKQEKNTKKFLKFTKNSKIYNNQNKYYNNQTTFSKHAIKAMDLPKF